LKKKFKIAVNTRFLIPNKLEGIGTYTHQVLQRLVKQMPEIEFHFLFDRNFSEDYIYSTNIFPHKLSPQARHPFLWYWWFEKSVTKWLKNNPVDLFLSLDSFMALKTKTPTFLVMHDLAFEHYPKHVPLLVRKYYQYYFPKYAKNAALVFAVSNFTKNDIISKYGIEIEKVKIAYCGVSDVYKSLSEKEKIQTRNQISKGEKYFICIGSLNPRKNIQRVVQAFNLFKKETSENFKLLIVGAKAWKTNILFEEINTSKYKEDIIVEGHLEPHKLSLLLASAEALVFPSLFEGFGLPIVEAYQCNTAVISSNNSSTKEIGEGLAILVNPLEIIEIKDAMIKIASKTNPINEALVFEKLSIYNWDKTVEVFKEEIYKFLERKI